MLKWISTAILVVLLAIPASAQQWKLKRMEGILGIGTTNVYSDLGGAPDASSLLFIKDITFRSTRPSIHAGVRYRINPRSSVKTAFTYGFSKTSDFKGSRNEQRSFSSVTQLFEIAGNYEFYLLPEFRVMRSAAMFNRRGMINDYSRIGIYVFTGIAGILYWPELELPEPRPDDEYRTKMGFTGAVPVGAGFKIIVSDKYMVGYEIGYRQSFTDFMDGFVPPSSKRWDGYWISSINLIYRIPTSRRGIPLFLDPAWKRARF